MPSFAEFRASYEANSQAFGAFAPGVSFPAAGATFSNAAGSYAYGLDNAARGKAALAGGESEWAAHWAKAALTAGNFQSQAEQLSQAINAGTLIETVKAPAFPA